MRASLYLRYSWLNEIVKPLHSLAQSLLREFEDVFPNDLPSELFPFRGIKHDLLPGALLPKQTGL